MAQRLAPYNNSMRLGQGFNSYTQQICLDQAVLCSSRLEKDIAPGRAQEPARNASVKIISDGPAEDPKPKVPIDQNFALVEQELKQYANPADDVLKETPSRTGTAILTVEPWVKPQIVTYSSRFVDKLSDVTDSMNISGSLSIKTATIGGKANGS